MKEKVIGLFREKLGGEPEFVVRSPGRVNLIGEHTDYNDGFVMPFAVEQATWMALRRRGEPGVRLYSEDFGEWGEGIFSESATVIEDGSWVKYLQGVTDEFLREHPDAAAWEGVSLTDLPVGAGLSSSASFELAVAAGFAAVSGIAWNATEMALLAHRAEVRGVGVNCGTMDQLAVALGRKDHALLIDCRSLDVKALPLPRGCAVVILDTTKARTLAGSAYNERRAQCEEAARLFGESSLRDVSLETFRGLEREIDPLLAKRARHVITENLRTLQAAGAMEAGEAEKLGCLMNESHESLRLDYEVSCLELDRIVEAARSADGCHGARMTGAGFGGCAVALVKEESLKTFLAAVTESYRDTVGREPKLYATLAADGTRNSG